MKLKMLRQHFRHSKNNNDWVPKIAFSSEEEIKEKLGYDPNKCIIYRCGVCSYLHISSHKKVK